jgi:hypothetical protein
VLLPTVTVTSTVPAAWAGAETVTCVPVALTVMADVTGTPPNETALAPVKPAPLMVMVVPPRWLPDNGLTALTTGPYENLSAATTLDAPPGPAMVTSTAEVGLPDGAVAVMELFEFTVNDAGADPKLTPVAPVNPLPEIVTTVPGTPADGVMEVTDGFG